MRPQKKISILICFFILTSCYESLDFKQINNFVSKPIFTSALNYFTLVPGQFFNSSGVQEVSVSDVTDIKGLDNAYTSRYVVKMDFNAEIKNELDRGVTIQVEFLDKNSASVYTFTPIKVASKDLNYRYLEEITLASTPNLLKTSKVKVTLTLENTGTVLNPLDKSKFVFKSSVTLYIESKI